jgi:transcriptional regulator with XRE-family HTH domain
MREAQHLSTRELAQRSRASGRNSAVTASQINNIENSKSKPEFQTLQKIAAALDLPLVIILDGGQTDPDTVTILSTDEVAQSLVVALHREDVVELLMYCLELTEEQRKAILGVARSIRGFTRPLEKSFEETQE